MPKMFHRFVADDPRLLTGIGVREQNRIRVDGSSAGSVLYGPYILLPPGHYEATVKFDPAISPKGSATLDVAVDTGRKVLAAQTVQAEQLQEQGMKTSLRFTCDDLMARAEIRLRCASDFVAAVESVEISGEFPPIRDGEGFATSELPPVNVRNEITRSVNPYDGYQRGIALAVPEIEEKIKIDLDFQEALTLAGGRTIVTENNLANIFMLIKLYIPKLAFGHIVEFGSYRGGSAIFMASLAQKFLPNAQVLAFDSFSGMPPTDKAVDLHNAGDFAGVDLAELRQYVKKIGLTNLHFVEGRFENTAPPAVKELDRIVLCHIDCDIRSAIHLAYDTTRPHMVPGGYWVFDDPLVPTCLGAMGAVEDLLIRRDSLNAEQAWPHLLFREPFEKIVAPSKLDADRPVGIESRKSYVDKITNGFFSKYLSGEAILEIGYKGGVDGTVPIVPQAIGIDLDYPGYDGIRLPFPDESQDAVYSSHCFEHVEEYREALREWYRVLKVSGYLIIVVPHQHLFERRQELPSIWNRDHKRFYTPASLLREIEEVFPANAYRVRHLIDNDRGFDYTVKPLEAAVGCYEIELVIEKLAKPVWDLEDGSSRSYSAGEFATYLKRPNLWVETDFTVTDTCIIWGPYQKLQAGDYNVRYFFEAIDIDSQPLASEIHLDVAQNMNPLTSVRIVGEHGNRVLRAGSIDLQFSNSIAGSYFEFRIYTYGQPFRGKLRFYGVSLDRVWPTG